MKKTKLTRLIAVFLSLIMLGSAFTVSAVADETTDASSTIGYDIDDVRDLLNSETYTVYAERNADVARATESIVINGVDYNKELTDAAVEVVDGALLTPGAGTVAWDFEVPSTAKYAIKIEYNYPEDGKATSIERRLRIDGEYPFKEARYPALTKVWHDEYKVAEDGSIGFNTDAAGNDTRPGKYIVPAWQTYTFSDSTGYYVDPYEVVLEAGAHTLSLEATREDMIIKTITLCPYEDLPAYADVLAEYTAAGYQPAEGAEPIILQAELADATSAKTIYPQNDRTSAMTQPQSPTLSKLNTLGGTKWQGVGQWIEYTFTPEASGLYEIAPRYKQSDLSGMYTSRRIYINGEIPFEEANYLQFNFSEDWKIEPLNNGETSFQFYFEAGKEYTIRFEVVLGNMSEIIGRVQEALTSINNDYLKILQITGADPDTYRDYNFHNLIPDTIRDLYKQYLELADVSAILTEVNGGKGSNVATLDNIARILKKMATDEDEIARNMSNLKSNIGTLGTWLNTVRNQPVLFDYIMIQPAGEALPKAEANFFQAAWFEISAFFGSFFTDYSSLGVSDTGEKAVTIDVWAQSDRDSAQVVRTLCDNRFSSVGGAGEGIGVNIRLVAAGTLLPATLSGTGPDVALENAQTIPVQYAIRSAVQPLNPEAYADEEGDDEETKAHNAEMREVFANFDEVTSRFSESATVPLSLYGVTYGLPETQTFQMMFYRKDVFAELGLGIPKTWDDLMAMIPVLQYNHMEVGIPNSLPGLQLLLYQMGGELYADDGMRINLDSNLALEAFDTLCSYFTQYSFPYQYDAANRFRTGEMPLIFADYVTMYNQLSVFATEIRDLWEFIPVIGIEDEDGNINNTAISTVTSIVMMAGCEKQEEAWKFMDWYTTAETQADYANEKVAIVGQGAMFATANKEAIAELPWGEQDLANIMTQYNNLATIPEMPGGYIITRYVEFAFLDALNNNADPVESLLDYIDDINKEITRKRKEFDLDTLELGETLADREARENGQSESDN